MYFFATRSTIKLILINFLAVFISSTLVFAQGSNRLATDKNVKNTKPWANIDGFRSAKFGMSMENVKTPSIRIFSYVTAK